MPWNVNLTNLRDILADLYFTAQDSRRVVAQAGLNPAYIEFDNKAITNWYNILTEANKRNKVQDVIVVARKDYPENDLLALAEQSGLTTVRGPDIADKVDWAGDTNANHLEKVIGAQSTLLPVSFLEVGLQKARAVVLIRRGDGDSGSGFLISGNLVITNHHVLSTPADAASATLLLNYQQTPAGLDAPAQTLTLAPAVGFATSKEDDWTAVRVQGNPDADWGVLPLATANPQKDDRVIIIQHPGGGAKQVALYHNVVVFADKQRVQYLTDTLPGSSGSPVFDKDWNVVAVHHSGGWLREPGSKQAYYRNEGIHVDVVLAGLIAAGLG